MEDLYMEKVRRDPASLSRLVKDFDLAGVACWKLGFESSDIWDIVSTVK